MGHYCPGGTAEPQACPAGTLNNQTGLSGEAQCQACLSGEHCPTPMKNVPSGHPKRRKKQTDQDLDGGHFQDRWVIWLLICACHLY